jgi:hypothetical protein
MQLDGFVQQAPDPGRRDRRDRGVTERFARDIPVVAAPEVLVVGGGSAGIAASVAAARAGAKTMLIERYGFLGGTSTAALVGPIMTSFSTDGHERIVGGIFQEIVANMVALGGAVDPATIDRVNEYGGFIKHGHTHVTPFHPEALKLVAQEMVTEAGVDLLLHTTFVETLTDGRRAAGAIVTNKAGLGAIRAQVVVDTSADGDVAASAGAPFAKGRPEDGKMQPATMFFRVGNVDDAAIQAWAREHPDQRLFESVVQAAKARGEFMLPREYLNFYREPEPGVWRVNVTRVLGIDGTEPRSLTRGEVEGRRQVWWLMNFMREHCRGFERAQLLEAGTQLGVRETRRIIGEYVLTGEDCLEGRRFPDAVARGSYLIDIHDPTGTRTQLTQIRAPFYDIPYRCLIPKETDGLLVAGRCISVDHVAFGSTRVIPQCYATGQAAGAAAATAVRSARAPRTVEAGALRSAIRAAGGIC